MDAALAVLDGVVGGEARLYAMRMRAVLDAARGAAEADAHRENDLTSLFLPAHLAGTLGIQQATAVQLVEEARHLVLRLPGTLALLEAGAVTAQVGRVLVEETAHAGPATCAQVEAEVLGWLAGRTAGEVRRRVRRVLLRLADQAEAARRRRRAVAGRAVSATPLPDGMLGLWAVAPAVKGTAFLTTLRRLAAAAKTDGDERTAAQRELDVLVALPGLVLDGLTGALGSAVQAALVQAEFSRVGSDSDRVGATLLFPAASALGQSDEPVELLGYGPISAEHARAVLADADLRAATVDPGSGRIVAVSDAVFRARTGGGWAQAPAETVVDELGEATWTGWVRQQATSPPAPPEEEPGYRMSRRLRRMVRLRDPHCVGVGCTVPSHRCDGEHRRPWPHGPTSPDNLAPVSRRCHRMKQAGWRYTRAPDGATLWTAPHGRRYRVPPSTWPCPPLSA